MLTDIGNANWWGRALSAFGWRAEVRVRRSGRRQTYRRWLKVDVFNHNYSDEARAADHPSIFEPTQRGRCHNCGQDWEGTDDGK